MDLSHEWEIWEQHDLFWARHTDRQIPPEFDIAAESFAVHP